MFIKSSYLQKIIIILLGLTLNILYSTEEISLQILKDTVSVDVEGTAPQFLPNAKWEAIQKAMRHAVEEVAGLQIEGGTANLNNETKNFLSIRTEGYVSRWELIEEKEIENLYKVKIRAWVRKLPLNKDLFLYQNIPLKAIYEWLGKPRVAVDIVDLVSYESGGKAQIQELRFTQHQIQKIFIDRGITVVEVDDSIWNDPNQTKFEIGIKGTSTTRLSRELPFPFNNPIGKLYVYHNTLELKVIKFPGKHQLVSEIYFEPEINNIQEDVQKFAAFSKDEAVTKAIQRNIESRGWDIMGKTIKSWYLMLNQPKTITLIIKEISSGKEVDNITRTISILEDVLNVRIRGQVGNRVEYEVEYNGTTERLAGYIEDKLPFLMRIGLKEEQLVYQKSKEETPILKSKNYLVSIKGLTISEANNFLNLISEKVTKINQENFEKGVAYFNIDYVGTSNELSQLIEKTSKNITITGYSGNRITGEVRNKEKENGT